MRETTCDGDHIRSLGVPRAPATTAAPDRAAPAPESPSSRRRKTPSHAAVGSHTAIMSAAFFSNTRSFGAMYRRCAQFGLRRDAVHRGFAHLHRLGKFAHRPVSRAIRRLLLGTTGSRAPAPSASRFAASVPTLEPPPDPVAQPPFPLGYGRRADAHRVLDLAVGHALAQCQDQSWAERISGRQTARPRPTLQLLALFRGNEKTIPDYRPHH